MTAARPAAEPIPIDRARRAPAAPSGPPAISVQDVHKIYGPRGNHVLALSDISFDVQPGEFVCLVGASGCGKTTLLNLVAGLDRPAAGTLEVHGRKALLFQEAALFPWLTAAGNVELALRLAGVPRRERRAEALRLLRMVRLQGFADRRPHELSGGMRQRVALARAFAQKADILLMDEPFGSLDAMTRDLLHDELERLWTDARFTVLFVTHDVREAVRLGDRVLVLTSRPGRVATEIPVELPRPRAAGDAEAAALVAEITSRLREEVRRHATD
ncbi:MAG TPA: ABC transporter ATP-binding protein [Candidatus Limnocylindria bacterium]|nr:ABC transporter ATP-binding protein [Candidatus Limnocylindria bacterium]